MIAVAGFLLAYAVTAYVVVPAIWEGYEKRHPALADVPGLTRTADGIPGDPLNVALVGPEADLRAAMKKAGWHPADPLSLESDAEIAADTVLDRPYADAPVSSLYLWGRKEDLAFEKPAANSPRKRHHVRLWRAEKTDDEGRPLWVGAATFDESVGLSHTTGQVTHHIAPDVDAERDGLVRDLERTGGAADVTRVAEFHDRRTGRNGGGDPWRTDGDLLVVTLAAASP